MGNDFEFMEENPPEMEDFGLDFSIYENFRKEKESLLNSFETNKENLENSLKNYKEKVQQKKELEVENIKNQIKTKENEKENVNKEIATYSNLISKIENHYLVSILFFLINASVVVSLYFLGYLICSKFGNSNWFGWLFFFVWICDFVMFMSILPKNGWEGKIIKKRGQVVEIKPCENEGFLFLSIIFFPIIISFTPLIFIGFLNTTKNISEFFLNFFRDLISLGNNKKYKEKKIEEYAKVKSLNEQIKNLENEIPNYEKEVGECFENAEKQIAEKIEKVKEQNFQEIENLEKQTFEKLKLFEKSFVEYYENWLDDFYQTYLYKKRAGTQFFEKALNKFEEKIEELLKVNDVFLTKKFYLEAYKNYIWNRKIDNEWQTKKKELNFTFYNSNENIQNDDATSTKENEEEVLNLSHQEVLKNDEENLLNKQGYEKKEIIEETDRTAIQKANKIRAAEDLLRNLSNTEENDEEEEIKITEDTFSNENEIPKTSLQRIISPIKQREPISPQKKYRTPQKIDYLKLNQVKKQVGDQGENLALISEKDYLISIGKNNLAEKVCHSSQVQGDGLGYDILSFFEDGREKYIEVKTTTQSIESNFYLSPNELEFMKENSDNFQIYRIQLSKDNEDNNFVRVYEAKEILEKSQIIPSQYVVKI